ncbi:protein IWS1 homolog [Anopheles maculipalpis]|uniref:protein IWS1 homolog n=1 Tax=Anopheles maculipalpis TaxID=1496333 RepID=UPI0021595D64|nr:protein IWS1 homolog [Anopheles maculipalpis]
MEQIIDNNDTSEDDAPIKIQNDSGTADKKQELYAQLDIVNSNQKGNIVEELPQQEEFVSDFDTMIERRKAERSRCRKRNKDHDCEKYEELVVQLLHRMRQAAIQDRLLNVANKPATKKIAILHQVMQLLIKKDLQHAFIYHNVLCVLTDWIAPLPNKALPCLQIRTGVLKLLLDFPTIEKCYLKQSGIGKAVMYLYKHPDETKDNRMRAHTLLAGWFRSIYNISTSFNEMSLEERRQQDLLQQVPCSKRSIPPVAVPANRLIIDPDFSLFTPKIVTKRPGDRAWSYRARVPCQSDKVYIVRPKSQIEFNHRSKQQLNRYQQCMKRFYDMKRKSMARPLVSLSIEGTKLRDF